MVGSSPIDLQFNLPLIPWRESEEEREKRRERDESFFHPKLWGTFHEPKGWRNSSGDGEMGKPQVP